MTVIERTILTGIALTVADITPAAIRSEHRAITPDTDMWLAPEAVGLLSRIDECDREARRHTRQFLIRFGGAVDDRSRPTLDLLDDVRAVRIRLEDRLLRVFAG